MTLDAKLILLVGISLVFLALLGSLAWDAYRTARKWDK
jgi:hypothetical protein